MPNTKYAVRLAAAANACYKAAASDLSYPALRIAQRAIAARYGFTLDTLRSAIAARCGWKFACSKLYL